LTEKMGLKGYCP